MNSLLSILEEYMFDNLKDTASELIELLQNQKEDEFVNYISDNVPEVVCEEALLKIKMACLEVLQEEKDFREEEIKKEIIKMMDSERITPFNKEIFISELSKYLIKKQDENKLNAFKQIKRTLHKVVVEKLEIIKKSMMREDHTAADDSIPMKLQTEYILKEASSLKETKDKPVDSSTNDNLINSDSAIETLSETRNRHGSVRDKIELFNNKLLKEIPNTKPNEPSVPKIPDYSKNENLINIDNAIESNSETKIKQGSIQTKISTFEANSKKKIKDIDSKNPKQRKPDSKFLEVEEKKNYFCIYSTIEDSSSEYKMLKVKFNEKEYKQFISVLSEKVVLQGFYGDFSTNLQLASNFLKREIDISKLPIFDEGIVAFLEEEKVAMIFKTNPSVFLWQSGAADSGHLAVIYLRYLIDLCPNICISPPINCSINPDYNNPFIELPNPTLDLQEQIIQPSDKISLTSIPLVDSRRENLLSLPFSNLKVFSDFSRYLCKINSRKIMEEELRVFEINWNYINKSSPYINKRAKFSDIKYDIYKYWINDETYFYEEYYPYKFKSNITSVFGKVVEFENRTKLEEIAHDLQKEYSDKYAALRIARDAEYFKKHKNIHETLFSELQKHSCEYFKEELEKASKYKRDLLEKKNNKSWSEKFFDLFKNDMKKIDDVIEKLNCNTECKTLLLIKQNTHHKYPKINFEHLSSMFKTFSYPCLHKKTNLVEVFQQPNLSIKIEEERINRAYKEQIKNLNTYLLDKFFEQINPYINSHLIKLYTEIDISFFSLSIIRNTEHKVENWNFNQLPSKIYHKFGKDFEGEVYVKNILFIDDNSAIIQFSHLTENKSCFYYFNCTNKQQHIFQFLMRHSSNQANIIINAKLKLWCIYDNSSKRFSQGKLTNQGKIEEGTPFSVYEKIEDTEVQEIISATFLNMSDSILFINQNFYLMEYKYQSRKLSLIIKKENKGGEHVVKTRLKPEDENDKYYDVQSTPDGKNVVLRSRHYLDIYDLNWTKVYSFKIDHNFIDYKIIFDKASVFLLLIESNKIDCIHLQGITSSKYLKTEITGNAELKSKGNPILDFIYFAFKKFGPHSDFLGCPSKTEFNFLKINKDPNLKFINDYFSELELPNSPLKTVEVSDLKFSAETINKDILPYILCSRVPLHVSTIENSTLVPLQDGKNISDQLAESLTSQEKSHDLIERIISMIRLGVYEEILKENLDKKIHVVSIVGRQSSGKSYGMNRIFGTRFNVASTRCTDGIWISIVKLVNDEAKLYVVLDCEGLFSTRRNDSEEMKLCLTLAAVSDIMILNQDLSFNRYLTSLFSNFSKGIGRLKGKKLFRGYLLMLIRDVGNNEYSGAYSELQSNISQVISNSSTGSENFLNALFGGKLKSQCLNFYEKPIFNREIINLRKMLIDDGGKTRWQTGKDFLDSFKITLAQVYVDDDTDLDMHKLKITCEHLYTECLKMFFNGGKGFEDYAYESSFKIVDDHNIKLLHNEISFETNFEDDLDIENYHLNEENVLELLGIFIEKITEYKLEIHNSWMKAAQIFIGGFLEQRADYILNFFKNQTPKDSEFQDEIKSYVFKLKTKFDNLITNIKYCDKTCRKCSRICNDFSNHKGDCNCKTEHICLEVCNSSEECKENNYKCVLVFGHESEHKCNEGNHRCGHICDVPDCGFICNLEKVHSDPVNHDCKNSHPCKQNCIDKGCLRTCQFDRTVPHDTHICGEKTCGHKCVLCNKPCKIEDHLHDMNISSGITERLIFKISDKEQTIDYHICGDEHQCESLCDKNGVCQVDYNVYEKVWKNEFGEFNYPFFEPKESKLKCKILIPSFMNRHEEQHNCKISDHRCSFQCPECKSFCNEKIDHGGLHKTNTHRNKEQNVFVSSKDVKKLTVLNEGKARSYKVGESCQPENCTQSCERKGKAHFHLRRCKGTADCDAKSNPYVRHSKYTYYPYEDIVFDEWLCGSFWNSMNWEVPSVSKKEENNLCNFVCNHSSHKDVNNFCLKNAWHTDKHEFECVHPFSSGLIDVVFCCDCTGSMSSYLEKSKDTVNRIINLLKSKDVLFGFVGYRDHPPQDTSYVTVVQGLTSAGTVLTFISKLSADGGGDGPEAVMDGLYDGVFKMSWRKDSSKYLIHIADAPPHGNIYHDGNGDGFPSGCPCGTTIEVIANKLKEVNILYKLLKIGSYPNKMASIFKSKIENYEEGDLDSALDLETKVTEILIRDIKNEEIDFNAETEI